MDREPWWAAVHGVAELDMTEHTPYDPTTPLLGRNPDFPGGSDGKASAYNVGDLGSSPGSGRSPGEGKGNPLQYSCLPPPKKRGLKEIYPEKTIIQKDTCIPMFTAALFIYIYQNHFAVHLKLIHFKSTIRQ